MVDYGIGSQTMRLCGIIYNGKTVQEVYDEIQEEKRQRDEHSEEEEER